jgi:S-(hydroxymethyl)glutathione dehydrogenase/alcohol dehydrogenase
MRAAVLYEVGQPLVVEDVDLAPPKPGEVLVQVAAAGVCHSDLHVMKGEWRSDLPIVLGHEGAGVVVEIGAGVRTTKPGDHVILSWVPNCGRCHYCSIGRPELCDAVPRGQATLLDGTTRLSKGGQPIHHFAWVACFAEYVVVPEGGVVPIAADLPLDRAAIVGCAVMTGVGAVTNTARIEPGSAVAVFGCGGVGLNCVQGAALAGAARIIAVDIQRRKLDFAREFGATDLVDAAAGDPVAAIRALTGGVGVDYAFEALGNPRTIRQGYDALRKGGTVVVAGMAPDTAEVSVNALSLAAQEKVIRGSRYGSARMRVDIPRLLDLYRGGRLKLDELVTRRYRLDEINAAYDALQGGEVGRGVIVF